MKKIIFIALAASVVLAGCSKSESVEVAQGRAVAFRNAAVTRASTALDAGTFNIEAYKATTPAHGATPTFTSIYNLTTDLYVGTPTMYYYDGVNDYWFYGYGKTNATTTAAATGFTNTLTSSYTWNAGAAPSLDFTAAAGTEDLVVMGTGKVAVASQTPEYATTFYHALSRVRFTARTQTYEPTLSQIKITSITFTTPKDACNVSGFGPLKTAVVVTPSGSTAGSYVINSNLQTELKKLDANSDGITDYQPATTDDKVFFVVPQTLTGASIVVNYTVGGVARTKTFSTELATNIPGGLVAGTSYNFAITINLNMITFDANLEDWIEATATELQEGPIVIEP